MVALILFVTMFLLMFIGVPIVFAIGAAGAAALVVGDVSVPLTLIIQRVFTGSNTFALCCIPFFVLSGQFMASGNISRRLVRVAEVFVGRIPGGLGHVNVLTSMMFGGISGSSSADVASIGPILMPLMHEQGYDDGFTVAVTAASSTIGVIIPPSNMMIIYATVAVGTSISDMFLGGILPGIMIGIAQMIVVYIVARRRHYPRSESLSFKESIQAILQGIPPLITFVIIIGGVLSGIFTPTESGIISALYNFILAKFVYKTLKWNEIPKLFLNTVLMTSAVLLLIGMSSIFSWLLAYTHVPETLVNLMLSITTQKYPLLLMMMVVFLLIGCVMDDAPACIIFIPMFLPIAMAFGMNPAHFGVFSIMCLAIGQFTPPVGAILFLACKIGNCTIERAAKALVPFFLVMVLCCVIVLFFEPLVTWIPSLTR